ncbi:hypothetical protein JG688_00005238 [Phytophthora aleatoria]|uniref:Uncharacterized protein n=1 Tax=Phytophthora aleatoria TaxID=2496075 RepID=A0A8J5IS55_9STRA|nr:hypothetical protein JG688_00005238 [Phytophthora aleatoria]
MRTKLDHKRKTSTRYATLSWKARSHAICYYLHPSLGNFDGEVTCRVFGVRHATFSNWISKSEYYPKWLPFVEGFVSRDVLEHVPAQFQGHLVRAQINPRVTVPSRCKKPTTKRYISAASGSGTSRQKTVKLAKKTPVRYITTQTRTVGSGRKIEYRVETSFLLQMRGNPEIRCLVMRSTSG